MTTETTAAASATGEGTSADTAPNETAPQTKTTTTAATSAVSVTAAGSVLGGQATGEDPSKAATNDDAKPATEGTTEAVKADVVPSDGVYTLSLPDGVEIDEAVAAKAFPLFKELGLTAGQADKLAGFFAGVRTDEGTAQDAAWERRNTEWVNTAKADKTYAGVGFEAAAKTANLAVTAFGDAEFNDVLQTSGLGNHPAVIRAFFRIGARMANDTTQRGAGGGAPEVPVEERMYGATTPTTRRK